MRKPPKQRPEYKGERADRTSGEKLLCWRCARLATHRARKNVQQEGRLIAWDDHYCTEHLQDVIRTGEVYAVQGLPEYRLYIGRLTRWKAAQGAPEQGTLL